MGQKSTHILDWSELHSEPVYPLPAGHRFMKAMTLKQFFSSPSCRKTYEFLLNQKPVKSNFAPRSVPYCFCLPVKQIQAFRFDTYYSTAYTIREHLQCVDLKTTDSLLFSPDQIRFVQMMGWR